MISFNEQHNNLSLQKIFYLHCVCTFSLSYLGEGGGGVIKYKTWKRGIKFSISIPVLIISEVVCSGLIKLQTSFILVLEMYLSIVCENMNVFVCGHMHECIVIFLCGHMHGCIVIVFVWTQA